LDRTPRVSTPSPPLPSLRHDRLTRAPARPGMGRARRRERAWMCACVGMYECDYTVNNVWKSCFVVPWTWNSWRELKNWELPEGHGQDVPPGVLQLCILCKTICQFSILPWGRSAILRRRLEWAVYDKVRVLWVPDRGWRPMGWGSEQQLPLTVLQLHVVQEESGGSELFRQSGEALLQGSCPCLTI